jgi:hypothetical protein
MVMVQLDFLVSGGSRLAIVLSGRSRLAIVLSGRSRLAIILPLGLCLCSSRCPQLTMPLPATTVRAILEALLAPDLQVALDFLPVAQGTHQGGASSVGLGKGVVCLPGDVLGHVLGIDRSVGGTVRWGCGVVGRRAEDGDTEAEADVSWA